MITTIDGVEKNYGDGVYYIAYGSESKQYYPCVEIVEEFHDSPSEIEFFHDKNLCQQQCDLMNKDKI